MCEVHRIEEMQRGAVSDGKIELDVIKVMQQLGIHEQRWFAYMAQLQSAAAQEA